MPKKIEPERIDALYRRYLQEFSSCKIGMRLPAHSAARKRFNCTRKELQMVLRRLEEEGLVRTQHRLGSFWNSEPAPKKKTVFIIHIDWPSEYWLILKKKFKQSLEELPDVSVNCNHRVEKSSAEEFLSLLNPENCSLAILFCSFRYFSYEDTVKLLSAKVPIIFMDSHIICRTINSIDSMPGYTGMLAAAFLVSKGHRKIALLNGDLWDIALQRELDGFCNCLAMFGLKPEIIECRHSSGVSSFAVAEEKTMEYLQQHGVQFTAVFATSAAAARGLLINLKQLGFSVPEDISIIVNSDLPGETTKYPPLTAISRDYDGYAKAVTQMAKLIFEGKNPGFCRIPSYINDRGSVRDISDKAEPLNIDPVNFFQNEIGMNSYYKGNPFNFHTGELEIEIQTS